MKNYFLEIIAFRDVHVIQIKVQEYLQKFCCCDRDKSHKDHHKLVFKFTVSSDKKQATQSTTRRLLSTSLENALKLNLNKFKILNLQNAITYKNEKKTFKNRKSKKLEKNEIGLRI